MDISLSEVNIPAEGEEEEKFDYDYLFNKAKDCEKEGNLEGLKSSIFHIEAAIESLRGTMDAKKKTWLKKFNDLDTKVRTAYYSKKIKMLTDKAKKEEQTFKKRKALEYYNSVRKTQNQFYKLGNNKVTKEDIGRTQAKINELMEEISQEDLVKKSISEKAKSGEEGTGFGGVNAIFEEVDLYGNSESKPQPIFAPVIESTASEAENDRVANTPPHEEVHNQEEVSPIDEEEEFFLDELSEPLPVELFENATEEEYSLETVEISSSVGLDVISEKFEKEKMPGEQFNLILSDARKALEGLNFYVLTPESNEVKKVYDLVNIIAIKKIDVSEFLSVCKILAIKISKLSGSLIVSERNVQYQGSNLSSVESREIVNEIKEKVTHASSRILSDLAEEGPISKEVINYLDEEICLEKSRFSKKGFFYRQGRMEYKFDVVPIVLSSEKVKFLEKNIPYAIQRNDNTYYAQVTDLRNLLRYLTKRETSIEEICVKKHPIKLFLENKIRLSNILKLLGITFGFYSLIFLLAIITLNLQFVTVLSALSYPLLVAGLVIVGVMLANYKKKQNEISDSFGKKFGLDHPDFSENRLIVALDQVGPIEREQFIYEIYGKRRIPVSVQESEKLKVSQSTITEIFETDLANIPTNSATFSSLKKIFNDLESKEDFFRAYCALRCTLIVKMRFNIHKHLGKSKESVEKIHDIHKLLQMFNSAKLYEIERGLKHRLERWETMRKKKMFFSADSFKSAKRDLIKIMSELQESVDEASSRVTGSSESNSALEGSKVNNSDSIRNFLED